MKGPELLNKYVGESERKIREVFQKAKDKAADDVPVVILPNTSNPGDWAKIAGRKGERIVAVTSLVGHTPNPQRNVEKVITTGQYL